MRLDLVITLLFLVGYAAIIFERSVKINKTASALLLATSSWTLLFLAKGELSQDVAKELTLHLADVSQIIFFLFGAMTLVELIDAHKGFRLITNKINVSAKKKMLWILGIFTFFLSSILDNLTTTIVMLSLLRKLVPEKRDRMFLGGSIVIAANAGGAWTPIGDVTTTMLWIRNHVTTFSIMEELFFPSLVCLAVSLFFLSWQLEGNYPKLLTNASKEKEPGAFLVFFAGVGSLLLVPILKAAVNLPPFMGMLVGVGILWAITDRLHSKDEDRKHLQVPFVLTKIDISGVLFFLGILLAIDALQTVGVLQSVAFFLESHVSSLSVIALLIGGLSAIVDNVPLVAAVMNMYPLQQYPTNHPFWAMLAYTAGTGGSMLVVGSAAGVALMGIEKVGFLWYASRISLSAFIGYLAGFFFYLLTSYWF